MNLQLPDRVDVGIRWAVRLPGCVPVWEEREAARFTGMTWAQWLESDEWDRACAVAQLRTYNATQAHAQQALNRHQQRKRLKPQR